MTTTTNGCNSRTIKELKTSGCSSLHNWNNRTKETVMLRIKENSQPEMETQKTKRGGNNWFEKWEMGSPQNRRQSDEWGAGMESGPFTQHSQAVSAEPAVVLSTRLPACPPWTSSPQVPRPQTSTWDDPWWTCCSKWDHVPRHTELGPGSWIPLPVLRHSLSGQQNQLWSWMDLLPRPVSSGHQAGYLTKSRFLLS